MQRCWGLWRWALSLIMPLMAACVAEGDDFIFVLATPPGQRSEIHWLPAHAPENARVLVEDLEETEFIHRHRDELWWWTEGHLVMGDLVGQGEEPLSEFDGSPTIDIVRQGDILYWMTASQLGSYDLNTKERQVLAESVSVRWIRDFTRPFLLESAIRGFRGMAVYEDRLYFGDGPAVESIRLDGTDRRQLGTREYQNETGPIIQAGLFGGGTVSGPAPRGLVVHHDRVIWVNEGAFWQRDLKTDETSQLSGELPESVHAMVATDEAIYWIGDRKVWQWKEGVDEHEPLYELGDTKFHAITAVTADPIPATMWSKEQVGVIANRGGNYQLLFSADLKSWAPDFVGRGLGEEGDFLSWLSPQFGRANEALVWQLGLDSREAYFAAWQYHLEGPFDADGDQLPDYWERRHFKDLSATPEGDTNEDGITHREEARWLIGPNEVDSDGDGLSNAEEVAHEPPLDPVSNDTDGDTLSDGDEVNVYRSDPHSTDTDADGFTDDFEVAFGGNPNDGEVGPLRDEVLAVYEEDLLVHFDFESSVDATVRNRGRLGGLGWIVGEESYLMREMESGDTSRALNLVSDSSESDSVSHVETDYSLEELEIEKIGREFTIAFWMWTESAHLGTLLGAGLSEGDEQGMLFQVKDDSKNGLIPIVLSYQGLTGFWSSTSGHAVPVGKWAHVVWTEEPGRRSIYIDGVPFSTQTIVFTPLTGDPILWLGAQQGAEGATLPFRGALDDVRVYRGVLPKSVVKVLAR